MLRSLRTIVLLLVVCGLATPFDFSALKSLGHVSDYGKVLDTHTKAVLERYCRNLREVTGAEIALVTVDTLQGEPIEDVANLLYRKWNVGSQENDEGVLLLLAVQDSQCQIEVGDGLIPQFPKGYKGTLLAGMRRELRARDYGRALSVAAHTLGSRIAEAKGMAVAASPPEVRQSPHRQDPGWPVAGAALLVLLLGGMMLTAAGLRRRRPGESLGQLVAGLIPGRSESRPYVSSARTSGAFGGYDSRDSFGGFGGGDAGEGEASSRW